MSASLAGTGGDALPWGERALQRVLSGALAAFGFFVLFSTAGTNLALGVLLLLCLAAPQRIWRLAPWREPVVALGLVLLAWIALRAFSGAGAAAEGLATINRYRELLLLPLLWALLRLARRPQAFIHGLLAGALLYVALHWLAPLHSAIGSFLYSRRISAGLALPVCAFLLFEHARLRRVPRAAGFAASALLALTVLFAAEGRTGHVLLLALAACAAYRAAAGRWRLAAVAGVLALGMLLAASSAAVRGRMGQTMAEIGTVTAQAPAAAPSVRVELARSALRVAQQHWLAGIGWPGYAAALPQAAGELGVRHAVGSPADNPHNEYLLQWGAGGLPALALFIAWLASPVAATLRAGAPQQPWAGAAACVALAFAASALVNSVLLDFTEGHFYVAVLAWLLARRVHG